MPRTWPLAWGRWWTVPCALLLLCAPASAAGPEPQPSAKSWIGHYGAVERALREGEQVSMAEVGTGVTKPWKAVLRHEDETFAAVFKPIRRGSHSGWMESYQAEIAAYRLDRLLGLDMVPPTVERKLNRRSGSLQLWVRDSEVYGDLRGTRAQTSRFHLQTARMKMFDNLINNPDRNAGNFLVDATDNVILIDHSRAFRPGKKLDRRANKLPLQYEREVVEALRELTSAQLAEALGDLLDKAQRNSILVRRDALLLYFEQLGAGAARTTSQR